MAEEKKQCYQWKKGENGGAVDRTQAEKKVGEVDYIVFESGRLINKSLIDEFLVPIPSLEEPMFDPAEFAAQTVPNPNVNKNSNASLRKTSDYPSAEELANFEKNGQYSLGKAEAIPHPDQLPPPPPPSANPINDNFTRGLAEEGKEHLMQNNFTQGLGVDQSQRKAHDPIRNLIDKTKKKSFNLSLNLHVQLPVAAFFEMLDDDFVKDNLDSILNELINKIKQTDLDSQLKENLIKMYNINTESIWQQSNTTEETVKE